MADIKLLTVLETVYLMIEEGDRELLNAKNMITRLEILDRLGKRLMIVEPKIQEELGKNQQKLRRYKQLLNQTEKSQDALQRLQQDILDEEKQSGTLPLKGD